EVRKAAQRNKRKSITQRNRDAGAFAAAICRWRQKFVVAAATISVLVGALAVALAVALASKWHLPQKKISRQYAVLVNSCQFTVISWQFLAFSPQQPAIRKSDSHRVLVCRLGMG